MNYYNSVELKVKNEQGFSPGRSLDSWGTALLQPFQNRHGGRRYEVDTEAKVVTKKESLLESSNPLTTIEKIQHNIGVVFKYIAVRLSDEVKAKYELANTTEEGNGKLWSSLENKSYNVSVKTQGDEECTECSRGLLTGCCESLTLCCQDAIRDTNSNNHCHHHHYHHHGDCC